MPHALGNVVNMRNRFVVKEVASRIFTIAQLQASPANLDALAAPIPAEVPAGIPLAASERASALVDEVCDTMEGADEEAEDAAEGS